MVRTITIRSLVVFLAFLIITGCIEDTDTSLAPYQGQRALEIIKITRSPRPDIQWLGGRVAAVGVNEGDRAALDSTLVWLTTAETDTLSSYQTYGTNTDGTLLSSLGATAADSLDHGIMYTFWLATGEAFEAGLDSTFIDEHTFADTTVEKMPVFLSGRVYGEKDLTGQVAVEVLVEQVESMLDNYFILSWLPADIPFEQIAIRKNAALPGYDDLDNEIELIWHIVDTTGVNIYPPVIIGDHVPNTLVHKEWPEEGFSPTEEKLSVGITYNVWMTNEKWLNSFSRYATGLAWKIISKQ